MTTDEPSAASSGDQGADQGSRGPRRVRLSGPTENIGLGPWGPVFYYFIYNWNGGEAMLFTTTRTDLCHVGLYQTPEPVDNKINP